METAMNYLPYLLVSSVCLATAPDHFLQRALMEINCDQRGSAVHIISIIFKATLCGLSFTGNEVVG